MSKFILYHSESESYMYAHSDDEAQALVDSGLTDVTGQVHHEMLATEQLGAFDPDANMKLEEATVGASVEVLQGSTVTVIVAESLAHLPELTLLLDGEAGGPGNVQPEVFAPKPPEVWYFTFGSSSANAQCYVRLQGSFEDTRQAMFAAYGPFWCMQYSEKEFAGQPERFGLREIALGVGAEERV